MNLSHIKNNEEYYSELLETIYGNDRIFLSKSLLAKEFEQWELEEELLEEKQIHEENMNSISYIDDDNEITKCQACDNNPCICSDPQHNW